jgi:hypothetical protein
MQVSYSFHISSKGNAITSADKIAHVSRHNLRAYKSEHYRQDDIEVVRGSDISILDDVRGIYEQEFSEAIKTYNANQKRADRQIKDYLNDLSIKRSDVAVEIIIQVGDMDYWSDKSNAEKRQMSQVFKDQLTELEKLCPDFKIANAVIHFDEKSPHMHVVGVPVACGYSKGLSKRVTKTRVFTRESLSMLQDKMREHAEKFLEKLEIKMDFKPKEKGRNKDIPKHALEEYYKLVNQTAEKQQELTQKQDAVFELDGQLRKRNRNVRKLDKAISEKSAQLKTIDKTIAEHEDLREVIAIYNQAYDDEIELEEREYIREDDFEI